MSYDDIRFSHWDDPEDDMTDDDSYEYYDDYDYEDTYEEFYADGMECVMCGRERSLNDDGYCSSCWTIWNS